MSFASLVDVHLPVERCVNRRQIQPTPQRQRDADDQPQNLTGETKPSSESRISEPQAPALNATRRTLTPERLEAARSFREDVSSLRPAFGQKAA
jgi:hypothetical protein